MSNEIPVIPRRRERGRYIDWSDENGKKYTADYNDYLLDQYLKYGILIPIEGWELNAYSIKKRFHKRKIIWKVKRIGEDNE